MRASHKVLNHHKYQWPAAMTTHWVQQPPTVVKYILICRKLQADCPASADLSNPWICIREGYSRLPYLPEDELHQYEQKLHYEQCKIAIDSREVRRELYNSALSLLFFSSSCSKGDALKLASNASYFFLFASVHDCQWGMISCITSRLPTKQDSRRRVRMHPANNNKTCSTCCWLLQQVQRWMNHQGSTVFGRERWERRWHDYCCNDNNTPWIFLRKSGSGKGGNCIDSMPADPDSNPASAAKWNAHSYPDCQDFSLLDISHQKNKNKTKLERTRTRRRKCRWRFRIYLFYREQGRWRAESRQQGAGSPPWWRSCSVHWWSSHSSSTWHYDYYCCL